MARTDTSPLGFDLEALAQEDFDIVTPNLYPVKSPYLLKNPPYEPAIDPATLLNKPQQIPSFPPNLLREDVDKDDLVYNLRRMND